jgi:8-oxo-dGTP diphosphatase
MSEGKKHYVNTFIFSSLTDTVLLIEKNRPEQQRGRLNGIGGKIEAGENPLQAAVREICEECGLEINIEELIPVCRVTSTNSIVAFFAVFTTHENLHKAASITDEQVMLMQCAGIQTIPAYRIMPNLRWQIPMALMARERGSDGRLHTFEIQMENVP